MGKELDLKLHFLKEIGEQPIQIRFYSFVKS